MPFSNIAISLRASPHSIPVFQSFLPLSIIFLIVNPFIESFSISFSKSKLSYVSVTVFISFKPNPMSLIVKKVPFIQSSVHVLHNTLPFSYSIFILSHIQSIMKFFNTDVFHLNKLCKLKNFTFKFINHDTFVFKSIFVNTNWNKITFFK